MAIVLLSLGFAEKLNHHRKSKFSAAGIILMGIMIIATPFSWYGYWAITTGGILMNIGDLLIVMCLSIIGGIIITHGIKYNQASD